MLLLDAGGAEEAEEAESDPHAELCYDSGSAGRPESDRKPD